MVPDWHIKRRICPFISSGEHIQYCKGAACNAAQPVLVDGSAYWVCSLIHPDLVR